MPRIDELWRLEHLGSHGVLHHVDASAGVLREAVGSKDPDDVELIGATR
jgi:hypothetical protein